MSNTSSANRWSIVQVPRSVFAASISILSLLVVTFYYFGAGRGSIRCLHGARSASRRQVRSLRMHASPRVSVTWDMLVKGSIARSKEQTAYLDSPILEERKKFNAMTLRSAEPVSCSLDFANHLLSVLVAKGRFLSEICTKGANGYDFGGSRSEIKLEAMCRILFR